MRVLLVGDDCDLSKRIAASFKAESFVVDIARNGEDAEHLGLTELYARRSSTSGYRRWMVSPS